MFCFLTHYRSQRRGQQASRRSRWIRSSRGVGRSVGVQRCRYRAGRAPSRNNRKRHGQSHDHLTGRDRPLTLQGLQSRPANGTHFYFIFLEIDVKEINQRRDDGNIDFIGLLLMLRLDGLLVKMFHLPKAVMTNPGCYCSPYRSKITFSPCRSILRNSDSFVTTFFFFSIFDGVNVVPLLAIHGLHNYTNKEEYVAIWKDWTFACKIWMKSIGKKKHTSRHYVLNVGLLIVRWAIKASFVC